MAAFDEADLTASAALDRFLAESVIWRPMRKRAGGGYTGESMQVDPARPVLGSDGKLLAIVSWKPRVEDPGTDHNETAGILTFDVVVDFDREQFRLEDDTYRIPREGDVIELSKPWEGNTRLQIDRHADDDSARLIYYCVVPE